MPQSYKLILLQVISLFLGFFSIFFIAGNIPPELYAIVGVYEVISSISRVFSNLGLETLAIRNILYYKEKGFYNKISELVTQSLYLRILLSILLLIPLNLYAYYISNYKFNGGYLVLFILMTLSSIFISVNDSIILLLKSFNKYFTAAFINFTINILGRILAILGFIIWGFDSYISIIIVLPLFVTFIVVFKIKEWINFKKYISFEKLKANVLKSKHFTLSSYVAYVYNMSDQLLVSLFFSSEVLSSYSLGKRLMLIFRTIIENIFDPVMQKLISIRNQTSLLNEEIGKIIRIKNILLILLVLFIPVLVFSLEDMLLLLGLNHYPYLNTFIICIYLSILAFIQMKIKYNFIVFFYESIYYLKVNLVSAVLSVIFFFLLAKTELKFIFLYIGLTYLLTWLYSSYIFKIKGGVNKKIKK